MRRVLLLSLIPFAVACSDDGLEPFEPPGNEPPVVEPPAITGTIYYVSPAGSDNNAGTVGAPFASLEHALENVARAGDAVLMCAGTYSMNEIWVRRDRGHGGAPGNYLTVKAYDGVSTANCEPGEPVLQYVSRRFIIAADYMYIEGLHFVMPWTLDISGAGHMVVGNTFSGEQPRFGAISAFLIDGLIHGNRVDITSSSGSTLDHGMYIHQGRNVTISNNTVSGTTGYGLHVYEEAPGSSGIHDVVIENNVVSGSEQRAGIIVAGPVPISGITIRNNLLLDNSGYGIVIRKGDGIAIVNNTVAGNGGGAIAFNGSTSSNVTVQNNILVRVGEGFHVQVDVTVTNLTVSTNLYWPAPARFSGNVSDPGAVVADPAFVNAAGGDYHLSPSSAAVDAGLTIPTVTTDFEGTARPQDDGYDIGADELG
jgi:parallel beta-helix repeat protein